jgi:hypothetical protein
LLLIAAIVLPLQWSVLLPVVMTLIANQNRDTAFMKILVQLCYPKWALEAFIIANAERFVLFTE